MYGGYRRGCFISCSSSEVGIQELWVAFGTGKNFRYMPIHEIVTRHSFVICYKGKEDSMGYLESVRRSNCNIPCISTGPDQVNDDDVTTLERFTILLYDHTSSQHCRKLPLQQGNCCAVVARKGAEGSASARRQL